MKLSNCLTFSGVGILTIASTRSSDGFRPSADITCPMYATCCREDTHLSRRSIIPYSFGAERTCVIFCRCSSFVRPLTITSSRYVTTCGMPETRLSTNFWKMVGAGVGPNDNRLYRNSPLCVFTTSNFIVASSSSACKYASDISSFEKCCPCSLANISSTIGMGCWSTCSWGFTVTLWYPHMRTFPFDFCTTTMGVRPFTVVNTSDYTQILETIKLFLDGISATEWYWSRFDELGDGIIFQ